ncbi:MAG: ATP-binding protein [Proteiniphilum sp.]|uniref:ATP-binding protein n=1 Tax=Proteiniphilum sp. TaxID=1926877 RepID=UPI002B20ED0F|nr:ATP-binding protein [Proteiniphilum sp.]MEA5128523.1 ATP-binding protein [Proteiniphilum sp.]
MKFVDRTEEAKRLRLVLSADKSTFTVIYGRRRLGKSTLITRALSENDVYYSADQTEAGLQREILSKMIASVIPGFDKAIYPDWNVFFDTLNDRTAEKFTLCIDEFPYLVGSSPDLPSILQNKIDSKRLKFNLIICGSSQQLMYGLVLEASSPLYGRADAILKITPIKVSYIQEALGVSATESVEEYSVWGGIPRYWELREGYANLREAIEGNLLSVNGTLYEEPMKLFKDDITDTVKTSTIMSYVGAGAHRLSEIAGRSGEIATNLSRPLAKLISLGYLTKEIPFGENEKSSKKSLYKISDPFMNFYFQFIIPNRSFIEIGRISPVLSTLNNHFSEYVGNYWERLCRETISGNEIDGITYGMARRWWGNVSKDERMELDVVAESVDKKYLLVGECKWTTKENSDRLLAELREKAEKLPFASKYTIITKLFLKNPPIGTHTDILLPDDIIKYQ